MCIRFIEMTQVENEIRRKLMYKQNHLNIPNCTFRREMIWIQCFHWPNIITCGKYLCAFVMPKWYFVFNFFSRNVSISASTRKGKNNNRYHCVCACFRACACVANENQALDTEIFATIYTFKSHKVYPGFL